MDSPIQKVKKWIISVHPDLKDINYDLNLIDNRLIDSLRFVDLIFLLEELTGESIEITKVDISHINTLQAIQQKFFAKTTEASHEF